RYETSSEEENPCFVPYEREDETIFEASLSYCARESEFPDRQETWYRLAFHANRLHNLKQRVFVHENSAQLLEYAQRLLSIKGKERKQRYWIKDAKHLQELIKEQCIEPSISKEFMSCFSPPSFHSELR